MVALTIMASGIYASQCVIKRINIIELCILLIKQFSCDIEYSNLPVNELIFNAFNNERFSDLEFVKYVYQNESDNFTYKWKAAIKQFGKKHPLLKSDLNLLESFGEKLGINDSKHQVQLCEEYIKRFSGIYETAISKKDEYMKMCRLVGAATSIFFLIMML